MNIFRLLCSLRMTVVLCLLFLACELGEVPDLSLNNPLDMEAANEKGIQTPALVFFPDSMSISLGLSVTTKVYAMDVENLGMAYIKIAYDKDRLSVTNVSRGDFFTGSQEPIFLYEEDAESGTMDIYTSFLGTDSTAVSGTGSLALLTFSTKAAGKSTLQYSSECLLLDPDSKRIEIKGFGEGVIDAK